MSRKRKWPLVLARAKKKNSEEFYHATDEISLGRVIDNVAGTVQLTTEHMNDEKVTMEAGEPYGDRVEEVRPTGDGNAVFFSLWRRQGTSKKGNPYDFLSTGNISLMRLRDLLGDSVRIFVGPTKSENPKAAPYYISFTKYQERPQKKQNQQGAEQGVADAASAETIF